MYKIIFLVFFVCASLSSPGQEHWLVPQRYFYSIREMAYIQIKTGQNKNGSTTSLPLSSIKTLQHYRPNGSVSSLENLLTDPDKDSIALPLQEAGTHMIVLQQTRGPVTLPVDSLENLFPMEDISAKRRNAQKDTPPKETRILIQESLKTLIQVSEVLTNACTQPSKLILDIIPEENPNTVPRPGWKEGPVTEKFLVHFKGKPLPHASVVVSYQVPGKGWQSVRLQTDKRGRIVAERHPGSYRISCVYSEPAENDPANELLYYWGSLCFDYSQYFR
jgi:hypothetical protein